MHRKSETRISWKKSGLSFFFLGGDRGGEGCEAKKVIIMGDRWMESLRVSAGEGVLLNKSERF